MLLCVVRLVRSKSEWGRGWDMMTQPGIPQLGRITSLNSDLLQSASATHEKSAAVDICTSWLCLREFSLPLEFPLTK